jgi:hypothetical protein
MMIKTFLAGIIDPSYVTDVFTTVEKFFIPSTDNFVEIDEIRKEKQGTGRYFVSMKRPVVGAE